MKSKLLLAAICFTVVGLLGVGQVGAQTAQGITIAPAALKLELIEGEGDVSTTFNVTNNYPSSVTLAFAVKAGEGAGLSTDEFGRVIFLADPLMTLAAGETKEQRVLLSANDILPPGSQPAVLTVSQQASNATTGVGVSAGIELPLTIVRLEGAVSAVTVNTASTNGSLFSLPSEVTAEFKNTGNSTLIPRGTVTLYDPRGNSVAHGVFNDSSLAVAPGDSLALQTVLTPEGSTPWPGQYRVEIAYGLGGGAEYKTFSASGWYIAWWHLALLVVLAAALYFGGTYGKKHLRDWKAKRHKPRPKRPTLIGRDVS